ncbi:hypothetical protein B566_EDAN015584 [Ephemera danica]|nr:hypothetical protein B566_EDAN015584 [Ephemera danica]
MFVLGLPQNDIAEEIKHFVKEFYDFAKSVEEIKPKEALPELIVDNFDDEQVWQQLELQNTEKLILFVPQVAKLIAKKNKLLFPIKSDSLETSEVDAQENQDESDAEQEEQPSPKAKSKKKHKKKINKPQSAAPTVVDDKFFKLREMHEFLEKEENNPKGAADDSIDLFADFPSSDDDEAEDPDDEEGESYGLHYKDFFDPVEGQEEENDESTGSEEEESGEEDGEGVSEDEDNDDPASNNQKKSVRFEPGSNEESGESEGDEDQEGDVPKSSFEGRQERLQKRIDQIHEEALSKKPWQLQGEVKATTRPQNSLLEEVLEFDMTSRPAPVITEQTTLKLEDIIRQRIKDKVWDDVERKVKPVETPKEFKKALVLDQEKSKLSLAQIYEKASFCFSPFFTSCSWPQKKYTIATQNQKINNINNTHLFSAFAYQITFFSQYHVDISHKAQAEIDGDTSETQQKEDSPEHAEIKKLMHSLFCKLDALSNYHYTPKLAQPEIKVISNLPAITVEEVGPAGTSDATLLAPEEVKVNTTVVFITSAKPRGTLLGKDERTHTDKKRERRKKKKKQRVHKLRQEAKEKERQKQNPQEESKKMSKKQAAKHVEKAAKEGTIKMLKDSGSDKKAVKSSTAFFSQLQDQVTSVIKNKSMEMKRKKESESNLRIKKLKMVK